MRGKLRDSNHETEKVPKTEEGSRRTPEESRYKLHFDILSLSMIKEGISVNTAKLTKIA